MGAFKKNLEKRKTAKGLGIFAKVDMPKDTVIFEFHGEILTKDKIPNPLKPEDDHYLQIGLDTFIGPSGDLDDYINHSCAPNSGVYIVGHRALLKAIMLIKAGAEITFDYSTTSTDTPDIWNMVCKCGHASCRKNVSGFKTLDKKQQESYQALGIVPSYLTEKK